MVCGKFKVPFYTKNLTDDKYNLLSRLEVKCINNNKGCKILMNPVGFEVAEHEEKCLERCPLCEKLIPYSIKHKHLSDKDACPVLRA